jgi:hypothetical protein
MLSSVPRVLAIPLLVSVLACVESRPGAVKTLSDGVLVYVTVDEDNGIAGYGSIVRVLPSGDAEPIAGDISTSFGIAFDPDRESILQGVPSRGLLNGFVRVWSLDGVVEPSIWPQEVLPNGVTIDEIAIDANEDRIYFTNRQGGALARMNADGTEAEEISAPGRNIISVSLDLANGKVYYTDNQVLRSDLDGTNPESIPTDGLVSNINVSAEDGFVYFREVIGVPGGTDTVAIVRLDPDTLETEEVTTGIIDVEHGFMPQFRDVGFDPGNGRLVVSDSIEQEIFTIEPDGTDRRTLVTFEDGVPAQIAVFADPDGM